MRRLFLRLHVFFLFMSQNIFPLLYMPLLKFWYNVWENFYGRGFVKVFSPFLWIQYHIQWVTYWQCQYYTNLRIVKYLLACRLSEDAGISWLVIYATNTVYFLNVVVVFGQHRLGSVEFHNVPQCQTVVTMFKIIQYWVVSIIHSFTLYCQIWNIWLFLHEDISRFILFVCIQFFFCKKFTVTFC